jgi:hypothetical protein
MQQITARWVVGLALAVCASLGPPARAQTATPIPCGFVDFRPVGPPRYEAGIAYERIRATLHFQDGHTESAAFPYYWVYPNAEQTDPWSATNLKRVDLSVTLQFPPALFDRSTLEPVLAFLIAHTDALGYTTLKDCRAVPTPGPAGGLAVLGRPATPNIEPSARLGARIYYLPHTASRDTLDSKSWVEVCATIVNRAPKPARRIRFIFEYADASGREIGWDELEVSGTFAPGMEYGLPIPAAENAGKPPTYCRALSMPAAALPRIQEILVSVRDIEYSDGSHWHVGVNAAPL